MAQVETQGFRPVTPPETTEDKRSIEIAAGGGVAQAVAAVAAVVLAIIGLAGMMPLYMLTISCIALGAALLFEGGAIAGRYSRMLEHMTEREAETAEIGGGVAAEAIAGAAGVALGILGLIGISTMTLMSVAVIIFGGGLLLGSAAVSRVNAGRYRYATQEPARRITREAVFVSAGGQVLIGITAVVLGILALLGLDPLVLTLVGMLGVGFSVMLSGTAIGARMMSVLHQS